MAKLPSDQSQGTSRRTARLGRIARWHYYKREPDIVYCIQQVSRFWNSFL